MARHHLAHMIVLTADRQSAVRLCDGKRPPPWEIFDLGTDTFSVCESCRVAAASAREVGYR